MCLALCAGLFFHAAKLGKTGDYKTVKQQHTVYVHPSGSSVRILAKDEDPPKWVLYHELTFTTKEFMCTVSPMEGAWLTEIAPHYYPKADVEDARRQVPHSKAAARAAA
jgi:pre-mRNA-splicing factor ATP-dependent RNA helicase DHX16